MKRKMLGSLFVASSILGVSLLLNSDTAFAHGYVETPPARGYQGMLDKDTLGWTEAFNLYGNVITNPQSLEAPKGFPAAGPADGRIASANGGLGQINDFVLDNQTSDRWKKTKISTGENTFTWHYTAAHKTTKWHYYMTKPGWDQNAPLNRDELELIGTVNHDGTEATNNLSHTIDVPENRMGYHVILAVWDVADTANAFYNVIDVNVTNTGIPTLPMKPTNLKSTNITKNTVSLSWDSQTTANKYNVYRNGNKITTVNGNKFEDSELEASTEYKYEVEAVSASGQVSEKSDALNIKTLSESTQEKPTTPSGLHSMGETESSVSLMWSKSSHTAGVKEYKVYRNGALIANTDKTMYEDKGLTSDTQYKYTVKAISKDGQTSDASNELKVKTKAEENVTNPEGYREFKLGTLTKPEVYNAKEIVVYKGKFYETLVTHSNYGDTNWAPDVAITLFKEIDPPVVNPEFKPELPEKNIGLFRVTNEKNRITLQFYKAVLSEQDTYEADVYRNGEKIGKLNVNLSSADFYNMNGEREATMNRSQPRIRDYNTEEGQEYTYHIVMKDAAGKEVSKSEGFKATR